MDSVDTASPCQLSYSLQTDPAVVQVSVAGARSSVAVLDLTIVNNGTKPVAITAIVVGLPVGDDAAALTPDVSSVQPTIAPASMWTVNAPSRLDSDPLANFTILPQAAASAPLAPGAAIILSLSGVPISHATGTASIAITESTGAGAATTAIAVTKYPAGFFFDGLLVNLLNGSTLQPVAQVPYRSNVTLSWNVSAIDPSAIAIFQSSNGGQLGPFYPSVIDQWTTPAPLVADTVFTVIVTTAETGGQPVMRALGATVSVAQPDARLNAVDAQTLSVAQAATLNGPVTASAGVGVTGGMGVDTLTVSGVLNADGMLNVLGGIRVMQATQMICHQPTGPNWSMNITYQTQQDGFWIMSAPGAQSIAFIVDTVQCTTASDWLMLPVRAGVQFTLQASGVNPTTVSAYFIPLGPPPHSAVEAAPPAIAIISGT